MTIKKHGICLTCAHSAKCALIPAKTASNGTQFCEEYETVHLTSAIPSNGKPSKRSIQGKVPEILGLCCNCAQYFMCRFPKPEAGVWHCEDYQ